MAGESEVIPAISAQIPASSSAVQVATNSQSAGPTAQPNKAEVNSMTAIGSMANLKEVAPEVYKAITQGIGYQITSRMRKSEARRKQLAKEYETK